MLVKAVSFLIVALARLVTAVRGIWLAGPPGDRPRIYFGNHVSHGDFVLIWTALPPALRRRTRPVAGSDYWTASGLRTFVGRDVFRAVLIDRNPQTRTEDPVQLMRQALQGGDSLILFPEGTRNMTDAPLLPFKSGLFHLARACPDTDLVPVWINNLNRVLPKGALLPLPLICTASFGAPLRLGPDEARDDFLHRAREALLALCPDHPKTGG